MPIFTAAIDDKLDEHGYILPGLGDAGRSHVWHQIKVIDPSGSEKQLKTIATVNQFNRKIFPMPMNEPFSYDLSDHARTRLAERKLDLQWVALTLKDPDLVEPHPQDANCRYAYRRIAEAEGRVLKVVYNASTEPWRIVTVHFDRRMRGRL